MNLHGMVAGAIGVVNPFIPIVIKRSQGYETAADGTQTPQYTSLQVSAQIQALAGTEIQRLNNLGIQGVLRAAYMRGDYHGIVREDGRGGDLFYFNDQEWLVVHVLEQWPDWSKVVLCLQRQST